MYLPFVPLSNVPFGNSLFDLSRSARRGADAEHGIYYFLTFRSGVIFRLFMCNGGSRKWRCPPGP